MKRDNAQAPGAQQTAPESFSRQAAVAQGTLVAYKLALVSAVPGAPETNNDGVERRRRHTVASQPLQLQLPLKTRRIGGNTAAKDNFGKR